MVDETQVSLRSKAEVIYEAVYDVDEHGRHLCFQWCHWTYWQTPTGTPMGEEYGYRFIWRHENGHLATRGQARLPSYQVIQALMAQAHREGWGELTDQGPHQM
jgi:hypothetical protein